MKTFFSNSNPAVFAFAAMIALSTTWTTASATDPYSYNYANGNGYTFGDTADGPFAGLASFEASISNGETLRGTWGDVETAGGAESNAGASGGGDVSAWREGGNYWLGGGISNFGNAGPGDGAAGGESRFAVQLYNQDGTQISFDGFTSVGVGTIGNAIAEAGATAGGGAGKE